MADPARTYMWRRVAVIGALVAGFAALTLVLLRSAGAYQVHVQFENAGQLVTGDLVEVGGLPVGKVTDIGLTSNAVADVTIEVDDGGPLHAGTTATIRAVGAIGVANRYIELDPGPVQAPSLSSGAVIDQSHTHPIVDLDQVLDSIDPATRRRLRVLLHQGGTGLDGVSGQANSAFHLLNPALSQTAALTAELARNQYQFKRLVRNASSVAGTLASRRTELGHGVEATAAALSDVAAHRNELQDALHRAPGVLVHASATLGKVRQALKLVPATLPLVRVFRAFGPAFAPSSATVQALRESLPALRRALDAFPGLARETVPQLHDLTKTVNGALPIFRNFRRYAPDLVNGFYGGLGNHIGGYYDANGEYVRIAAMQGAGGTEGFGSLFPQPPGTFGGYRTGLTDRCPGAAVEPAPDNSNPWHVGHGVCKKADDH